MRKSRIHKICCGILVPALAAGILADPVYALPAGILAFPVYALAAGILTVPVYEQDQAAAAAENSVADEAFSKSAADFSLRLLKEATRAETSKDAGDSIILSPISISAALAMAEAGASGDTLSQMEGALGGGMEAEDYMNNLFQFIETCRGAEGSGFLSAQAVWINEEAGSSLSDTFREKTSGTAGAEVTALPFDNAAADVINGWVDEHTEGEIEKLLEEISPDALMYLTDATLFKGEWAEQYLEYQVTDGEFTSSNGEKQKAKMLSGEVPWYVELGDAFGFVKPYAGGEFEFVAVLPPEDVSMTDFLESFSGEDLRHAYQDRKDDRTVITAMPEVDFDYEASLNQMLINMGMENAFSELAEFDQILDRDADLYISNVLHKASFTLDRNGTKAAAATAVEFMETAFLEPEQKEEIEIILDRPYLLCIVEAESGIPIFTGIVNSVE